MAKDIIYKETEPVIVDIEIERNSPEDFTVRRTENGIQVNHINFFLPRNPDEEEQSYIDRAIGEGLMAI